MSLYALQKLLRDVNRTPECRAAYFEAREQFTDRYDLTADERDDLLQFQVGRLYRRGVHGLLLRPFTIIHSMPEAEYLRAIRGED